MFGGLIFLIVIIIIGSTLGGFVFLLMGYVLSQLGFLGITAFEGAIVCVCSCALGILVLWKNMSIPPWQVYDDAEEEDDEEDELWVQVPQRQRSRRSKRRRRR